jgi:hypothetical protein
MKSFFLSLVFLRTLTILGISNLEVFALEYKERESRNKNFVAAV